MVLYSTYFPRKLTGEVTLEVIRYRSIRVTGPSNGRVNEILYDAGVFLGPQKSFVLGFRILGDVWVRMKFRHLEDHPI